MFGAYSLIENEMNQILRGGWKFLPCKYQCFEYKEDNKAELRKKISPVVSGTAFIEVVNKMQLGGRFLASPHEFFFWFLEAGTHLDSKHI